MLYLVKAELMPNLRLKLFFDNKDIRFLGTDSSKDFVEKISILKIFFQHGEQAYPHFQVPGKV